ncbi:surfeit locus protein 1 [Echinococcus multilocularis]|uniref:SURF1-like protein n=1 Tax=Echinococcus multilocularis TaxID=6211 RepID=A0A068Y4C8_ECHMU|nr:surfeit locus protein 1 [Echinococcus multilocularis]
MNSLSCTLIRRLPRFQRSCHLVRYVGTANEESDKKLNPRHFLLLLCPITAFSLGYWQIQRRRWKLDLIEKIEKIMPSPPIPLAEDVKASIDLPEFQPITVEGRFDHSREVIVGPRAIITDDIPTGAYGSAWGSRPSAEHHMKESNLSNFGAPAPNGYCIVTPFEIKDRPSVFILVNRGWVPTALRDPITRPDGQIQGTVKIAGFIRYNEKPPPFTPDPKTMSNAGKDQEPHRQYFSREVIRISETLNTLPLFIDADYASTVKGGPIGGQTKVLLRNTHTEYIITWFSLGALTLGMWMYWLFF